MKRSLFFLGKVDAPFPGMNLSPEKDVLQITISDAPDAGFTDYKELDTSGIRIYELSEKSMKILKCKLIT